VPELGISDTQFGLLTGFGFALLYTIVGIPLARYADTGHRVWIMTVCIALWSLMTVLCGLATEITIGSLTIGAFWVLLMCRVGVGIGEAGCTRGPTPSSPTITHPVTGLKRWVFTPWVSRLAPCLPT